VGPDRDRGSFLPLGDDLEQQLGAAWVDLDIAELVEQQEVQPAVAADHPGQRPLVGGFDELVDQGGGGDVADPAALLAGGQAEPDQQVRLAGAAVPEQHDRLALVQVGARGQVRELAWGDGGDGVGAEGGEPLDAREAGVGDAAGSAPGGAVVELGGQDLSEVGQVGGVFPGGDLGQPGGLVADGGQPQLAGR